MIEIDKDKYPSAYRLLKETGMTLDQALIYTESELEKLETNKKTSKN